MQNQINLNPISMFVNQVRSAELSRSKEVKMTIEQARLLSLTLTEILDKVNQNYESLLSELRQSTDTQVISVTMDGGNFNEEK